MNTVLVRPTALRRRETPVRFSIELADAADREQIARLRHEVYARELGQHATNAAGRLSDALDPHVFTLVARIDGAMAGFVSITPPSAPSLSLEKYFTRDALPFCVDEQLYEVRLLTVLKPHRGREIALLLMYAALRWVEAHGGTRIAAIGRREVLELYRHVGLSPLGLTTRAGAVTYELMLATTDELRTRAVEHDALLDRLEAATEWRLSFPFRKPAACFHGGAFFHAIGEDFAALERRRDVVNADVLDAWFPPAPGVLAALHEHLPWLLRTSPPTACSGLIDAIAAARGVKPTNLLVGGGSSDLIFRGFRQWLTPASHALILDPTYGEYAHVLERVIGCHVDRLALHRSEDYAVDPARLAAALAAGYDLVVIVNPNSPTGLHLPRATLEPLLRATPPSTRVWIDETYIEYAGGTAESVETFAAGSENVVVCKSLSKVYALSGARAAYLCAGPHQLEALRAITPPWVVGLPAQVAAVRALQDPVYYAARYRETHALRAELAAGLAALGWDVLPGIANFLLCHLPAGGPGAAEVVALCRAQGLFVRDAATMSRSLGTHTVRLAVKDAATNARMLAILREVLSDSS